MLRLARYTVFVLVIALLAIKLGNVKPNQSEQNENASQNTEVNEEGYLPVLDTWLYDSKTNEEQISSDAETDKNEEEITVAEIENPPDNTSEATDVTTIENAVVQASPKPIVPIEEQITPQITEDSTTPVTPDTSLENSGQAAVEATETPPDQQETEPLFEEPVEEIIEAPSEIDPELPCH